jgi:hypothetical protein
MPMVFLVGTALVGEPPICDSATGRSGHPHPTAKVPNSAVHATTMPLTRNTTLNPPASASHPRVGLARPSDRSRNAV